MTEIIAILFFVGLVIFFIFKIFFKILFFLGRSALNVGIESTGTYVDAPILKDGLFLPYAMEYRDTDGDVTCRKVDIKRVLGFEKSNGELYVKYIQGYCHLRHQERTFKIDRIQSLVNLDTGQVIEGWGQIINHFRNLCDDHPTRAHKITLDA